MSDTVISALIAMIGTSVASTVASILAYLKGRDNEKKLQTLSINVDGRLSQLLVTTEAKALAQGILEGAEKARPPTSLADSWVPSVGPAARTAAEVKALKIIEDARLRAIRMLEEARKLAEAQLNTAHHERQENTAALDSNTKSVDENTKAVEENRP